MNKRIEEKIEEIENFLSELESALPNTFEEYKNDFKIKAIGERYFEKIIESVIDLVFFVIKELLCAYLCLNSTRLRWG